MDIGHRVSIGFPPASKARDGRGMSGASAYRVARFMVLLPSTRGHSDPTDMAESRAGHGSEGHRVVRRGHPIWADDPMPGIRMRIVSISPN